MVWSTTDRTKYLRHSTDPVVVRKLAHSSDQGGPSGEQGQIVQIHLTKSLSHGKHPSKSAVRFTHVGKTFHDQTCNTLQFVPFETLAAKEQRGHPPGHTEVQPRSIRCGSQIPPSRGQVTVEGLQNAPRLLTSVPTIRCRPRSGLSPHGRDVRPALVDGTPSRPVGESRR